ncbi:glycosyltransferase [Ruminococcus sp.]|uniref:glycosyltransferase family 2 protein n=1 Tax=Ruminococcus sp. TaxID=41978 RepID=UPI001B5C03AC|nr:glycosyltransferase [Ruminococcus sp.]MBP5430702.1 glycosyltransferase [Ruminococcus sp.]
MLNRTEEEIMSTWQGGSSAAPLVSIRCITYNHGDYIGQALDGFLSQKTTFPFEVIVHEDASPDNTADVIREYEAKFPHIIRPVYEKENMFSKGDGTISKIINPMIRGKYVAYCEGDDYWIDENKLQKQIDFLEANPDYGMCYTNFNIYHQNTGETEYDILNTKSKEFRSEYTLEEWVVNRGYTAPMTWVLRKELFDKYKRIPSCDGSFVMFSYFLASAKVYCFKDDVTAVYRVLGESASHTRSAKKYYSRVTNLLSTQEKLVEKYGLPEETVEKIRHNFYNRSYKLIGMNFDRENMSKTKNYNSSPKVKLFYMLMHSKLLRRLCVLIWERSR